MSEPTSSSIPRLASVLSWECTAVGCSAGNNCTVVCEGAATCQNVDCTGTNNCDVSCTDNASCNINCTDANNCDELSCEDDAACLVLCTGANNCELACTGGAMSCPGDVVVCNRPCPECGDALCDAVIETSASCSDDCG